MCALATSRVSTAAIQVGPLSPNQKISKGFFIFTPYHFRNWATLPGIFVSEPCEGFRIQGGTAGWLEPSPYRVSFYPTALWLRSVWLTPARLNRSKMKPQAFLRCQVEI